MEKLTPQIIAEITGGKFIGDNKSKDVIITGAVRDNRDVKRGNLFICIQGARVDGHSFANSAFESGAACCLTEKEIPDAKGPYVIVKSTFEAFKKLGGYYRSFFDIPVIGITGSVGKTTTKELIAAVLSAKYNVLKTEMNMNNELGVPLTLMSLTQQHGVAVIEMGISDFGEMSRLAEMVRPDIFVITKIGHSHIKELGDLNGVLRAKTETFAFMKADGIAVLNGDDDLLTSYEPGMRRILFGLDKHNDFRSENICVKGTSAVTLDIVDNAGSIDITIPAYGSHLMSLAPAAVAIGRLLGLTDEEIKLGFLSYAPVEGRSNVSNPNGITLIDDCYNANPQSVKAALTSLSALPGQRVAILGDMFNLAGYSEQMHREVGVFAAQCGIDSLISHGDHARFIHEGFVSAGGVIARYYPNRTELIADIRGIIKKGDAVLVKASRGMHFDELLPVISGPEPVSKKT